MTTNGQVQKKQIIISGVNLFSGGTLRILQECLLFLEHNQAITDLYSVRALVHKKELFPAFKNIEMVSYPKPRGSWLQKLYYEYWFFKKISKEQPVHLWFSLYDMTPSVVAERRAVYCHNPSPFYKTNRRERLFDKGFTLFTLFYKHLYAINIHKNNFVVVQQEWIRKRFIQMFQLPAGKIIVAHPEMSLKPAAVAEVKRASIVRFIYPALPRVFKNFEVIIEATAILNKTTTLPFEVLLTLSGTENKYAQYIRQLAEKAEGIKLIGLQNSEQMTSLYQSASCLLFPSKLETWGLPITEAKQYNLPILVSNLPYARETVGDYNDVCFFSPGDASHLAQLMKEVVHNQIIYDGNQKTNSSAPFTESWQQTFDILLG